MIKKNLIKPIVIVANGKYPSHSYPVTILDEAKTTICTDGAANKLLNHEIQPTLIIGDMDSITNIKEFDESEFIHIPKQDNTDLEKVIEYCIDSFVKEVTILGATGIRDDLAFTNLLLLFKYQKYINLRIITDIYTIECIKGRNSFSSFPDQMVSLVATHRVKSISTKGLKYTLKRQSLLPSGLGLSNLATGKKITIKTSGELFLFRSHKQ